MYPVLHLHRYTDTISENTPEVQDPFSASYMHTTSDHHNPSDSAHASDYSIHGRFLQSGYPTLLLTSEVLLRSASYFLYM